MDIAIIHNEAELDAACAAMAQRGLRIAAISNTGLPRETWRVTFLPESAFLKPGEARPPPVIPRPVQEWLRELEERDDGQ